MKHKYYRFLNIGETKKTGDIFRDILYFNDWKETEQPGLTVSPHEKGLYLRPMKKVSKRRKK